MADYACVVANIPKASIYSGANISEQTIVASAKQEPYTLQEPALRNYRMRGYVANSKPPVFEEWITAKPTSPNPSGNPLVDIVIISSWVS